MKSVNSTVRKVVNLINSGHLSQAFKIVKKSSKNKSEHDIWIKLSTICGQNHLYQQGIECCKLAIQICPESGIAYSHMANAFLVLGDLNRAINLSKRAVQISQEDASVLYNYGIVLRHVGEYESAIQNIETASRLKPDQAMYHFTLGSCYQGIANEERTVFHYIKSLELDPELIDSYINLGYHYTNFGDLSKAKQHYDAALNIDPKSEGALTGKVTALVRLGEYVDAYKIIRKLIDSKKATANTLLAYANICDQHGDCKEVILEAETLLARTGLPNIDRSLLGFALGKIYDKKAKYDKAFNRYEIGNRASTGSFDKRHYAKFTANIISVYSNDFMRNVPSAKAIDDRPVFIVGMPRSGTSLIEQILSQHCDVFAAGERDDINQIIRKIPNDVNKKEYPLAVLDITASQIETYRKIYTDMMDSMSASAKIITDKMPTNYLYLGLIKQLFPEARVIHCKRDPRDTCLSIYFQNFQNFHPYSNDLNNIAAVYVEYVRLMEHWKRVLDLPIMDLVYENVTLDVEKYARQVVEFCGLEWQARCLEFYKAKRIVNTASFDQVNKPVYQQSVARWKNYEKYIGELITGLDPVLKRL